MRRLAPLVLVLVAVPFVSLPGSAQSDVCVDLGGAVRAGYGSEAWKTESRFQTRNEYQFQNQTRFWTTSLGYNVTLPVKLVDCDDRRDLGGADQYTVSAYVETGAGRVYAYVANGSQTLEPPEMPSPTRMFDVRFDVDGATIYADPEDPTVTKEFPALGYGLQVVTVEVFYATLPGEQTIIAGRGDVSFFLEQPSVTLPHATVGFPERALRKFSDFGAGSTVPMVQFSLALNDSATVPVTFRFSPSSAGKPAQAWAFHAVRTGPGVPPPGPLPIEDNPLTEVGGTGTQADDAAVVMESANLVTGVVDRSGLFNATLKLGDVNQVPATGELVFVAGFLTGRDGIAGGVGVLIPVVATINQQQNALVPQQFVVSQAPDPRLNRVTVVFRDGARGSGQPETGVGPGDLLLLAQGASGYDILAKGTFEPRDRLGFVRSTVPANALLAAGVNRYAAVGVFYTSNGQNGDVFYGLSWADRGFSVFASPVKLVEGRAGQVTLSFQSHTTNYNAASTDPGMEMRLRVTIPNMPDGSTFTTNLTLPERGSQVVDVAVTAPNSGDFALSVNVTTGDLDAGTTIPLRVLSEDEYRKSKRKWWDVPGFEADLLLVALGAALVLLLRRRK